MKKIFFRCDSSFKIGSGHLIRCLNLAKHLKGDISFISKKLPGNINSLVTENQFKLVEFASKEIDIEEVLSEENDVIPYIQNEKPDILIIDHYGINISWEKLVKPSVKKLIAIDDINRVHHVDAIFDQNFYLSQPKNYSNTQYKFLGPEYALISSYFQKLNPAQKNFREIKNIMVFFGGSDPANMTGKVLDEISKLESNIIWHVIIGIQNKHNYEKFKTIEKFKFYSFIKNIHELMLNCELYIGAGGSTSWERAKCGLPAILYSISHNQIQICENLDKSGCIIYLGEHQRFNQNIFIHKLKELISSASVLIEMHKKNINLNVASKFKEFINYLNI